MNKIVNDLNKKIEDSKREYESNFLKKLNLKHEKELENLRNYNMLLTFLSEIFYEIQDFVEDLMFCFKLTANKFSALVTGMKSSSIEYFSFTILLNNSMLFLPKGIINFLKPPFLIIISILAKYLSITSITSSSLSLTFLAVRSERFSISILNFL